MKFALLLGLVCAASVAWAEPEVKLGCQRLRVTLDPRLRPETVESEWASGQPRSEAPATLELVGCDGQVLDRLALAAPLAKIDPEPIRGAPNPTYLVSADLTVEAGSYNGPLTLPIEVVGDHLVAAVARSTDQQTEPIRLAQTGKASWRRVPNGHAEDLLFINCEPRDQGFVTLYRRYYLWHQKWRVKIRTRAGLWESDGDFPGRRFFP